MSTQSSYALLLNYKSIAQPLIKNPAPIMYTSGSKLQYLTPKVLMVFSLTTLLTQLTWFPLTQTSHN